MPRIYLLENHFNRNLGNPQMAGKFCEHCSSDNVETVEPDRHNRVHSFTVRDEDQVQVVRYDMRLCHGHFIKWLMDN